MGMGQHMSPKMILSGLLLTSSFLFLGCQGDEGQPVDYGPETPQASIDDALNKPLATVDPTQIQLGQYVDILQTQVLAGQVYNTTGEIGRTVVDRQETDTDITFKILEKVATYSDQKVISRELIRSAQKNVPGTKTTSAHPNEVDTFHASSLWIPDIFSQDRKNPFINSMINLLINNVSASATDPVKVTYHNLKVSQGLADPPAAVQKQANCGGVANCKIELHKVSFDMVVWKSDPPDKIHREFALSPQVPFFANLMSECDSLLVPVGDVKTLVTLCSDVDNFRYATPQ